MDLTGTRIAAQAPSPSVDIRRDVLAPAVAALAYLATAWNSMPHLRPGHPWFDLAHDHHHYIALAADPGSPQQAPFGWRPLIPLLARAVPGSLDTGFMVMSVLGLLVAALSAYHLALAAGRGRPVAWISLAGFLGLTWAVDANLFDHWLVDPWALASVGWITWAVVRDHMAVAAGILAVGILAKESVLVAVPLFFLWPTKVGLRPRLARGALHVAPALVTLATVRLLMPVKGVDAYRDTAAAILADHLAPGLLALAKFLLWTVAPAWVLVAALGAWEQPSIALKVVPSLVLVAGQYLLANDDHRLFVLAWPFVALLALQVHGRCLAVAAGVVAGGLLLTNLLTPFHGASPWWIHGLAAAGILIALIADRGLRTSRKPGLCKPRGTSENYAPGS